MSLIDRILSKIDAAKARDRDPIVVLDLDGTLYNNAPRTLRILQEFAHAHAVELPELAAKVDQIPPGAMAYKLADTLAPYGIDDARIVQRVEAYWFERFFTNEYVIHDLALPGAVAFVHGITQAGCVPAYLTGRDAPNMLLGTIQCLQRDGFPVGTVGTRTILKEDFETPDDVYKASVVEHLKTAGDVVAVFDNEPGLCNLFKEAFPDAIVAHVDTSYAPNPPALRGDVEVISDFREAL